MNMIWQYINKIFKSQRKASAEKLLTENSRGRRNGTSSFGLDFKKSKEESLIYKVRDVHSPAEDTRFLVLTTLLCYLSLIDSYFTVIFFI